MFEQEKLEKVAGLDERAITAKDSAAETEKLIIEFKPFLRSRVARYCARFDEHTREDFFSSAMIAFHEAIQSYDGSKGHFFPFADRVVCARIIDHIRKLSRHEGKTVSMDWEDDDEGQQSAQGAAISKISMQDYNEGRRRERLAEEIEHFKSDIGSWGLTMDDLVKGSPKHKELRGTYNKIISSVIANADIMQTIRLKKYFPIKSISEITGLPQKKLERARIYVLTALIIKTGDYDLLSDYIKIGGDG